MDSLKLIEELSNANGVSGLEDDVLEVVRKYAEPFASIKEDRLRNLYLHRGKNRDLPTVMIEAHSDEIGFMVQHITGHGMLKFLPLGGWNIQSVMGHKVRVRNSEGKYIPGLVASKPPHFMTEQERKNGLSMDQMVIDVGAVSKKDLIENYKIDVGAFVIPDATFSYNQDHGIMLGKAFDNRIGCAAVIETLANLESCSLDTDIVGTICSQEEVGTRGIKVAVQNIQPDLAIVFEGSPADDSYGDMAYSQCALKQGAQIRHLDASLIANPRFAGFIRDVALEKGIKFQEAVRAAGKTDAGVINCSSKGTPVVVIGIPVRYAHGNFGYCALEDYKAAINLCCEVVQLLNESIISSF
ncbi:M20/M25/M40 family metallo-hydrolase [bacterium]|nr:M20/M25/M40 family metallo-hydrolase [bacterium]